MFPPGGTNAIQDARRRKTRFWFENRSAFLNMLEDHIWKAIRYSTKRGLEPVFRLNGTSDISWEKYEVRNGLNIFQLFPTFKFYDYTKVLGRKVSDLPNYSLTFSRSESNHEDVVQALAQGLNVAVVFRKSLPTHYMERPVIDGDLSDLRFLDPKGVIVGLVAKGRGRRDTSGFVVDP
jgi:hypothetical protein